jgi:Fe-S cluster biogenesis protein NfuA
MGVNVTLEERVVQALQELEPRLEELAEGHAELMETDQEKGIVTLKLIGGRLN